MLQTSCLQLQTNLKLDMCFFYI